jgi:hypothetical protein
MKSGEDMMSCQSEILAAEIRETRSMVESLVAEVASTRTLVEGMQKQLLGNGHPGRCAEHGMQIARLERWRARLAGALAVVGVLWAAGVTVATAVLVERMKR